MTSPAAAIRPMTAADLGAVGSVTNTAFGTLRGDPDNVRFPTLLFETRLAADPAGCFVAASHDDPARLSGALFSVARGGLGWFGPLAVSPGAQRGGVGQAPAGHHKPVDALPATRQFAGRPGIGEDRGHRAWQPGQVRSGNGRRAPITPC